MEYCSAWKINIAFDAIRRGVLKEAVVVDNNNEEKRY